MLVPRPPVLPVSSTTSPIEGLPAEIPEELRLSLLIALDNFLRLRSFFGDAGCSEGLLGKDALYFWTICFIASTFCEVMSMS
jgi:hypothetical protein